MTNNLYDKYYASKWTSKKKINGWRHYEVRNISIKKQSLEIFSVCDKKNSFIIKISEINDRENWIPGWKEIV